MQSLLKEHIYKSLWLVFSVLYLSSCDKAPEQSKMIPKDANFVVSVNMGSMKSKNTDYSKVLDYLSGDLTDDQKKLMESGIDLDGTGYFFGEAQEANKGYAGGIIPVSDKDKFVEFVKAEAKNAEVIEDGETTIIQLENTAAISVSAAQAVFAKTENLSTEKGFVVEKLKSILATKAEESLPENDKNFKKVIGDVQDVQVWINTGELYEINASASMKEDAISMANTYFTANVNFESGKVVLNSKFFGNEAIAEMNKATATGGVNSTVIDKLPAANIVAALGISSNLGDLVTYLEEKGYADDYNKMLNRYGADLKLISEIFTGDIAIAVNDVAQEGYGMPKIDFTAALGLKDRAKLEGFLSGQGMEVKDGEVNLMGYSALINDETVRIIGVSPDYVSSVKEGKDGEVPSEVASTLSNNEFSLFVDVSKIPESYKQLSGMQSEIDEFESIQLNSVTKGDNITMDLIINLTNKEDNSLMIISKLGEKANQYM